MSKAILPYLLAFLLLPFGGPEGSTAPASPEEPRQRIRKALSVMVSEVEFKEARLEEVVAFLSQKAGVNIIINPAVYTSAGRLPFGPAAAAGETSPPRTPADASSPLRESEAAAESPPQAAPSRGITLHLKNVPLKVVLKYVLRYKNLRYIVEDYAIVILPVGWTPSEALCTGVFRLKTGSLEPRRRIRQQAGSRL
jgi:hypothetical protein